METQSSSKWGWWVVAIMVIALVIWGISSSRSNQTTKTVEGKTIKIGIIAPLTGGGAVFGNSLVDGIKLAQDDLKNTANKYEILIEDDGTNPAQSASAAQKLVNIDKVQALVTITSGTGNAVKPIAASAKITHICVCADTSVADNSYNFTHSLIPSDEAKVYVAEAKKRGVKTVAIWSQIQAGIDAIINSLEPQLADAGIKVLYKDRYDGATRDFKTSITKGQKTKPDTFFILAFPPSLDIIGQEFKDMKITNVSAISAFGITTNPGIFEGYWYTDPNLADSNFRARFEEKFPGIRFNVRAAPYGYDTFMMIVNSFEGNKDLSDYLKNLSSYDGKVGHVTKDPSSGNFSSTAAIWTIKNGRSELLK